MAIKQRWLNFVLHFSGLISRYKNKLMNASGVAIIGIGFGLLILEVVNFFISLPTYFFISPKDFATKGEEVAAYRLRRRISLSVVGGVILAVLLKLGIGALITIGIFSHSGRVHADTISWDFNNPFTFTDWQFKEKYMPFREKLREQKYTVKDTGISYRHITHWELSKLMPEGVNVGDRQSEASWRMFSIVEMAWLKIIARLRKFGFSLKQIVKVKEQIIHWNKIYGYYQNFESCLAQAMFSTKDTYLRVIADGNAYLVSMQQLEMEKILKGSNDDMLLISIKSVLDELGMTPPEIKARLELSDEEFELFDEVRHSGSNEVKAALKNGEITDMESSKTITELPLDSEIKDEAEKEGMYGRVLTQYEKGKRRSIQIVKRKKFDKK